jgi:8-oxo-dGTP pyrophosphatase MutT (NUDIX family)
MGPLNKRPTPQNAVACIIEDENKKIALQLRDNYEHIFFPGRWGFFGGAVELNELDREALSRELFEELALEVQCDRFTYLGKLNLNFHNLKIYRKFFLLKIVSSEKQKLVISEGKALEFFCISDITCLNLTPYDEFFFSLWTDAGSPLKSISGAGQ